MRTKTNKNTYLPEHIKILTLKTKQMHYLTKITYINTYLQKKKITHLPKYIKKTYLPKYIKKTYVPKYIIIHTLQNK